MNAEKALAMSAGDALTYQYCWSCGAELQDGEDHLCEYWSDSETGETDYCGWLRCPECGCCQGQRYRDSAEDLPHKFEETQR